MWSFSFQGTQRGDGTCLRSHSIGAAELGLEFSTPKVKSSLPLCWAESAEASGDTPHKSHSTQAGKGTAQHFQAFPRRGYVTFTKSHSQHTEEWGNKYPGSVSPG